MVLLSHAKQKSERIKYAEQLTWWSEAEEWLWMCHVFVAGAVLLIADDSLLLALDSGKSHLNNSKRGQNPPLKPEQGNGLAAWRVVTQALFLKRDPCVQIPHRADAKTAALLWHFSWEGEQMCSVLIFSFFKQNQLTLQQGLWLLSLWHQLYIDVIL